MANERRGVSGSWRQRESLGKQLLATKGALKQRDPRPTAENRRPPDAPADNVDGLTEEEAKKAIESGDLELIPKMMDREQWDVGAALMRHWFSQDSFTISTDQSVNTPANEDIVKLEWILSEGDGFKVARSAFDDILQSSTANYKTTNSMNLLWERLQNDTVLKLKDMRIGEKKKFHHYPSGSKTSALHSNHIQTKDVDAGTSGNQLVAALARFTFHLLAQGEVEILDSRRVKLTIAGVGVYVRDSYDFTDDPTEWDSPKTWVSQPLGCWDFQRMRYHGRTNLWNSSTISCVNNESFRQWRTKNNKGGDFRIFTDIRDVTIARYSFERSSNRITFTATKMHTVKKGDSLWSLAELHYGDGAAWEKIYNANKAKIGPKPDVIQPGTKLIIPPK